MWAHTCRIVIHELSQLFWHLKNDTTYRSGWYEPSSRPIKELLFMTRSFLSFQELFKLRLRQRLDRHVVQVGQASKLSHEPRRRGRSGTDAKVVNKKVKNWRRLKWKLFRRLRLIHFLNRSLDSGKPVDLNRASKRLKKFF